MSETNCNYICGPHLEPCTKQRVHWKDNKHDPCVCVKCVENQNFNLFNALADSVIDASDEEVAEWEGDPEEIRKMLLKAVKYAEDAL